MEPLYTAKKSKLAAFTFWRVLFFWLIIPTIIIIVDLFKLNNESFEFYDDKIIHKYGVLSKNKRQIVFGGVYLVSTKQTLFGRIFNYGDINVDAVGRWDIKSTKIKNPEALAQFLETKIVSKGSMTKIVTN